MLKKPTFQENYSQQFWLFLLAHLAIWTLLPTMLRDNLPLDSMECLAWGHEWQAGYHKHPPLAAWLSELFFEIFQRQTWSIYFLSQVAVCLAFIGNWKLAKEFLPKREALMAVLLLEGLHFYNFTSPEFNPNVATLPIVAWFNYFAWQTFKARSKSSNCTERLASFSALPLLNVSPKDSCLLNWLILAILAAAGLLTKYSFALHIASFCLLLLLDYKFLLACIKNWRVWLAISLFFAAIFPHLSWLKQHDFLPFTYIEESTKSKDFGAISRLINPSYFSITMILYLAPVFLTFLTIKKSTKNSTLSFENKDTKPKILNKKSFNFFLQNKSVLFLVFLGLGPFFLLNLQSLLSGGRIKDLWAYGFWNMMGILLFYFWRSDLSSKKLKKFWIIWSCWALTLMLAYFASNFIKPDRYSLFEGKKISKEIEAAWLKHFKTYLPIVAGDVWLAGNLGLYLPNRPTVFIDLDEKAASWTSFDELRKQGGVVIWNAKSMQNSDNLPPEIAKIIAKNNLKIIEQRIILNLVIPSTRADFKNAESSAENSENFFEILRQKLKTSREFNREKYVVGYGILGTSSSQTSPSIEK